MSFKVKVVFKDGTKQQERSYYSASTATDDMGKAMEYYKDRECTVTLLDGRGVMIHQVELPEKERESEDPQS